MSQQKQRYVRLYAWYRTPKGDRTFCVVDKLGKGDGSAYRTTTVKLIEHMDPEPIYRDLDEFWTLIDTGRLIECIPETRNLSPIPQ